MKWVGMPWREWAILILVCVVVFVCVQGFIWWLKQLIKEAVRDVINEEFDER